MSSPYFFVFDLDETLAEVYPLFYLLEDLRLSRSADARKSFVHAIAQNDLGVLRPGILTVMEKLYALQREGAIQGVIIYSNNGHKESLTFIRDVIRDHLRSDTFIEDCIHWDHPDRTDAPHRNDKTWDSLQPILEKHAGGPVSPSSVFFVDDLLHPELKEALGTQYLHVPPYNYNAPFDELLEVYEETVAPHLTAQDRSLLRQLTRPVRRTTDAPPPADPVFMDAMERAIETVIQSSRHSGGGGGGGSRNRPIRRKQRTRVIQKKRRHRTRAKKIRYTIR